MHGLISSVKMVYTIFAVNLSCLLLAVYHGMFTAVTEQFDIVLDEITVTLIFSGLIMHMPLPGIRPSLPPFTKCIDALIK